MYESTAGAAQCIGRPDNQWKSDLLCCFLSFKKGVGNFGCRHTYADFNHQLAEFLSVFPMPATSTPIPCTLYFSQSPRSEASIQRLSAVCPPMVGSTASIRCSCKICSMLSQVSGSKYTWSAMTLSVMMVAGLELMMD